MSPSNRNQDHPDVAPEPAAQLSAEERVVLARIHKQARTQRPNRLRRFLKNPPLFFWWWGW